MLWIVLLGPLLLISLVVFIRVRPDRLRMARRAKELLAQMPRHELKTGYLAYASGWNPERRKELAARIGEEEKAGWTFLKASEANPFKASLTWGGAVNLHFIRKA